MRLARIGFAGMAALAVLAPVVTDAAARVEARGPVGGFAADGDDDQAQLQQQLALQQMQQSEQAAEQQEQLDLQQAQQAEQQGLLTEQQANLSGG